MPVPSAAPLSPAVAAALAPSIPDSPRASPRQMTQYWREERLLEGTLSPHRPALPPSPRLGSPLSPRVRSSKHPFGAAFLRFDATSVDGSEPPSPRKEQVEAALAERLSAVYAQASQHASDAS